MKNAYIERQLIPCHFGLSLPENAFQEFYVLKVDGAELTGADELYTLEKIIHKIYGLAGLPVSEIVFTGFQAAPKRRAPRRA